MPKRPRQAFDASDPLSRARTAGLLRKLRSLKQETRILKADISAAANDDENHHPAQVHPEHSRSDWDHEHIDRISEMMDRAQHHMDEAERLKAQGMPKPKRRR